MPADTLLQGRYFDPDHTAMQTYVERVQPTLAAYGGGFNTPPPGLRPGPSSSAASVVPRPNQAMLGAISSAR